MKTEWISSTIGSDVVFNLSPISLECVMKKKESSPEETSVSMSKVEPTIELWGKPEENKELFLLLFMRECSGYLKTHALHAYPSYKTLEEPDLWATIQRTVNRMKALEDEVEMLKREKAA